MRRVTTNTSGPLICLAVALVLTLVFTAARAILAPVLGPQSPYMLYIAAVLIAGFVRGGFCGFLVMLTGGLAGFFLFTGWNGSLGGIGRPLVSLMVFWAVATLALMMANELRRHSDARFERLRRQVEAGAAQRASEASATQRAA